MKEPCGLRWVMSDTTEARLHALMEAAAAEAPNRPSDLARKVGAFYKSFMDEARIEALGTTPIAAELETVRATKSPHDLATLMAHSNSDFEGTEHPPTPASSSPSGAGVR